ncbi:SUMF1/EgtB/PvdO family nonheme iron enzyme [Sorangium sp. So ce1335]|uniref:SUMF1/EgtB/PvdO family nonheme iron enzyme n=1 Tax=Sorangium sp. So ce1335 TaxID=3133335 RepID=UPI003F64356B
MHEPIDVFFSYAQQDEALRHELEKHLAVLRQREVIRGWHRGRVGPGEEREGAAAAALDRARVILLLVSADYLASEDCYRVEMEKALERHRARTARVIPVLLRASDWHDAPFAQLAALPAEGRPVTSWPNRDEAWEHVARGIRLAIEQLGPRIAGPSHARGTPVSRSAAPASAARALTPAYPDAATELLSRQIEAARARRLELTKGGFTTAEIDREIVALRRQLREGGQVREGDSLEDGRYLLLERVGRGGFAVVWKAHDRVRDEIVAVKALHANLAGDPIARERFFRGARTMAELNHPAVVRVLEQRGEDGGHHYFVMEFIAGGDLRKAVLSNRISSAEALAAIVGVGEALSAAHEKGFVHRDVKPANILLDDDGKPRLSDFDLVAAGDTTGGTRTGALGTFVYASPESMNRPQDAGPRADVYSLAITALFCLYRADLPFDVLRDVDRFIDSIPCSAATKAALKRATALEPEKRLGSVAELCEALRGEGARAGERDQAPPRERTARAGGRRARALVAAGALVLASLGVAGWRAWRLPASSPPALRTLAQECPAGMVFVPAGTFTMGSPSGEGYSAEELPPREITVSAFCMHQTEVTVAQYRQCVEETRSGLACRVTGEDRGCNWGENGMDAHPVNCVDWQQADTYCAWLGARLPTEAEWEYAARGRDRRTYPWGNESPRPALASAQFASAISPTRTSPVGSHPEGASPFGLLDMAGNVYEWTQDWYAPYDPSALVNPVRSTRPENVSRRVVRGGSWRDDAPRLRAAHRAWYEGSDRGRTVGFRCVSAPQR